MIARRTVRFMLLRTDLMVPLFAPTYQIVRKSSRAKRNRSLLLNRERLLSYRHRRSHKLPLHLEILHHHRIILTRVHNSLPRRNSILIRLHTTTLPNLTRLRLRLRPRTHTHSLAKGHQTSKGALLTIAMIMRSFAKLLLLIAQEWPRPSPNLRGQGQLRLRLIIPTLPNMPCLIQTSPPTALVPANTRIPTCTTTNINTPLLRNTTSATLLLPHPPPITMTPIHHSLHHHTIHRVTHHIPHHILLHLCTRLKSGISRSRARTAMIITPHQRLHQAHMTEHLTFRMCLRQRSAYAAS